MNHPSSPTFALHQGGGMPLVVRTLCSALALASLLLCGGVAGSAVLWALDNANAIDDLHAPVVRESDLWPWGWLARHPEFFKSGWTFSASLLGILLIHEFGHYLACRWHGIRSTLPWVLPAPTLSGTAGAIIQIRSQIPSRDALMDVGIYGPLAGYLASAVTVAVGFALSNPAAATAPAALVRFGGAPLTIRLAHALVAHWHPSLPAFEHLNPHPVLVAGWIGLFITSLNLIPGGQLDGGHILYAVSPRMHKACTNCLPYVLFIAGAFFWAGWILWGLFLTIPAMRHPRVARQTE